MITSIVRDWGVAPSIVRITTTDGFDVISTNGYLTAQAANIYSANSGAFEWKLSDSVLVQYVVSSGINAWSLLTISPDFTSLCSEAGQIYNSSVRMTTAQVLGAYASPVRLIGAPGAGKTIIVLTAQVITEVVTTAFATGGIAIVQYQNTVHGAGTDALSTTIPAANITAASSQIFMQVGLAANAGTITGVTNQGLYFSNATAAFTAGGTSTVAVALQYVVLNALV